MDCETNPMAPAASVGLEFEGALSLLASQDAEARARELHQARYDDSYWKNSLCAAKRDAWDDALLSLACTEDEDSDTMSSRTSFSHLSCTNPDKNPEPPVSPVKSILKQAVTKVVTERQKNSSDSAEDEYNLHAPFNSLDHWVRIPLGSHVRSTEVQTDCSSEWDVDSVSSVASLSDAGSEDNLLRYRAVSTRVAAAKSTNSVGSHSWPDGMMDLGDFVETEVGVFVLY